MKNFKAALISILIVFTSLSSQASKANLEDPEIYSILFYADWCGSCKVLDPAIVKARGKSDLDNESVLFVRLDLSDATKRHQSSLIAHALGLGKFYKDNGGATGFMLLVDAETKEVISTVTKKSDAKAITSQIKSAISKVSS